MIVIGLTGSLGSGKTTAAGFFKKKGAVVLDADEIAHQQYKPGTKCWREIKKYFGVEVLNEDNAINRGLLTEIVFAPLEKAADFSRRLSQLKADGDIPSKTNPRYNSSAGTAPMEGKPPSTRNIKKPRSLTGFAEKEQLNKLCAIVHPAVKREIKNRLKAIKIKKKQAVVVIDAPLLFEAGLNKIADFTVCVWLPRSLQMERILARGALTKKQAIACLKNQMPAAEKKIKSDFVINNSGSFLETQKQVDAVFEKIKELKIKYI